MDFYANSNFTNIDLREEMSALLRGREDIVAQGRYVILRRLSDIKCVCWNELQGGPVGSCPFCLGEGWQFTETMELMYLAQGVAPVYKPGFLASGAYPQTQMGYTDPNRATGYCEFFVFPDYERYRDNTKKQFLKLYELKVTEDGGLQYPLTRTAKWKLLNVTPMHGDYGRIEYFELSMDKENF